MPSVLDTIAARIREGIRSRPAGQVDVATMRPACDRLGGMAPQAPGTSTREWHAMDVSKPMSQEKVRCEIVVPELHDADREIVYFHGGFYAFGSLRGYRAMVSHIARACRAIVWNVEYRLAPEHPFPAAFDDAITAWRAITSARSESRQTRYVMMGDSAGGNLVLATLVRARDEGLPVPSCAVLLSPWLDLEHSGASLKTNAELDPLVREEDARAYAALYANGVPLRDPRVSPLFAELRGLPPIYVQVAANEALHDDSTRFADRAREAGVDVTLDAFERVFHVWQLFAGMAPESDEAIARIGAFVRAKVPSRDSS